MRWNVLKRALPVLFVLPSAASAQLSVDIDASLRLERATILAEQAWLLANQKGEFAAAASQLREAAELLRDTEPEKVRVLTNAGHFHYHARQHLSAVSALQEAGEVARLLGDGEAANEAFLAAAWVAVRAGDVVTATQLLGRMEPISLERMASLTATIMGVAQ